jgi:hypothetical protein
VTVFHEASGNDVIKHSPSICAVAVGDRTESTTMAIRNNEAGCGNVLISLRIG